MSILTYRQYAMFRAGGDGNATVTRGLCVGSLYGLIEGIKSYKPEVKACKSDKRLQSYGHSKVECIHVNFLLLMSSAAAYLTLRRRLLLKILTSLQTTVMLVAADQ